VAASSNAQKLEHRFNATFATDTNYKPHGDSNGFTFPQLPIITNTATATIQLAQWGLIPHWAKPDWNAKYTLNARQETLSEKPSFKYYTKNRCLILIDAFYEWQHLTNSKVKHKIGCANKPFALAGLYHQKDEQITFTIVTTAAKGIMQTIHNSKQRMPIALPATTEQQLWLQNKTPTFFEGFTAVKQN